MLNKTIENYDFEKFSDGNNTILQTRNETGSGSMTIYDVMEGIQIIYNDFHMQKIKSKFSPQNNLFCIDHCKEGRLEQEIRKNTYSYIQAGDLKMDSRENHNSNFFFPLEHFHGITVAFDIDIADKSISAVFPDFPYKISQIKNKFCPKNDIYFLRKNNEIEHIFSELYQVPQEIKNHYMKIKIFELLLYLGTLHNYKNEDKPIYFYKTQTEKVKQIQTYIITNLQKHDTLEELSKLFNISLTTMKTCFKEIYGKPIYSYLKTCRMNKAAELLLFTDYDISKIAGEVGYDSPSKFTQAFKKEIGILPIEYRKRENKFVR